MYATFTKKKKKLLYSKYIRGWPSLSLTRTAVWMPWSYNHHAYHVSATLTKKKLLLCSKYITGWPSFSLTKWLFECHEAITIVYITFTTLLPYTFYRCCGGWCYVRSFLESLKDQFWATCINQFTTVSLSQAPSWNLQMTYSSTRFFFFQTERLCCNPRWYQCYCKLVRWEPPCAVKCKWISETKAFLHCYPIITE